MRLASQSRAPWRSAFDARRFWSVSAIHSHLDVDLSASETEDSVRACLLTIVFFLLLFIQCAVEVLFFYLCADRWNWWQFLQYLFCFWRLEITDEFGLTLCQKLSVATSGFICCLLVAMKDENWIKFWLSIHFLKTKSKVSKKYTGVIELSQRKATIKFGNKLS